MIDLSGTLDRRDGSDRNRDPKSQIGSDLDRGPIFEKKPDRDRDPTFAGPSNTLVLIQLARPF